ncbi:carboxypeptidase-like regulatory domain-containing protein [Paenimyroides aestuarii]|uniref:Carboxypeptidase-like regulatory domain-containing protein n=1 Tax=Paenimyroides aestuarii TaxID=2968490 RepID=A0ABY5NVR1_9FLAO|nr:carboxypeptidase-like regulatory domain-containing protein [Paenimyroides aestuarii]UUV22703.1 carboxypeptidase-like regulatory domain-containing protein [Paenimyroides aestuarii]
MIPYIFYGQEINGTITDEGGNKIPLVTIQLINNTTNKIITYTQTNSLGNFTIATNNNAFPLKLKVQHFSYESKELILDTNEFLNVVLEAKTNELTEIIIDTKAYDVIKKGDTLQYNLKSLLNGSELKLKDVVNKLPGLAIDEDGKIRYNGKIIDNLLFDGNEFFDRNHQIANDNITAEMIQKIELLTNYKNLSSIKNFDENGKTALNIGIKDNFKNKFKGNITLEGGFKERYNLHGNLYNFGEKTMFNLVTNTNNINYSVLSVKDYMDTRKMNGKRIMSEQFSQGGFSTSDLDLPSFLFADDHVKYRKLTNYTLNFSHKFSNKSKIEFISIFNLLDQTEESINKQVFFDGQSSNIDRLDKITGSSAYASNILKYEVKLNNDSYFNVNGYSLWSKDNQNQFLESTFLSSGDQLYFNNDLNFKTNKYGINAIYKNPLTKNLLIDVVAFYDNNSTNTKKGFHSSEVFSWFDILNSNLNQKTNVKSSDIGVQGRISWKLGSDKLIFRTYLGRSNEHLNNNLDDLKSYQLNDDYNKSEQILGVQYQGTLKKPLFNYSLGFQYNYTNHSYLLGSKKAVSAILPNFSISRNLNKNLSSYFAYNANLNGFSILNFLSNNLVDDYRSYILPSLVAPELMITDSYNIGLMYNIPEKNIFSSLSLSHSSDRKKLERTFNNLELVTQQNFQYIETNKTTSGNFTFNKKFRNIPFGLNFNTFGSVSMLETFINKEKSENENYNISSKLYLQSYFKNNQLNFNAGINYVSNTSKNSTAFFSNLSKLERITPFATLTGVALNNKFNWSIDSQYFIFKTSSIQSQNIFDLGFRTQYNFSKKVQFYLNAKNILNIRDNNTKNNLMATPNFSQEMIMHSLSGFANFGIIFSL